MTVDPGRLRVVVLGYVVRGPIGGLTWHHLQYVLGLAQLGHDVWFLEDSGDDPGCYEPTTYAMTTDATYGLRYAGEVFERAGVGDRWAYHDRHGGGWAGPAAAVAEEVIASADVVVNVSGVNPIDDRLLEVPCRVLLDTDPVFTQVRHRRDPAAAAQAARHTAFLSFAGNLGMPGCTVPDDGLPWRCTRQPVVLDAWPVTPPPRPPEGRFTTVMQWASYAEVTDGGRSFGVKAQSFDVVADLPSMTPAPLELCLGSAGAPRDELARRGWIVRDPGPVSEDPWRFQRYLQESLAEFSVAKHGYVVSGSGWFSERTCGYLASGRPAVVQDTGWSSWLEPGLGVLSFCDVGEAVAAVDDVLARPAVHAGAARDVAEAFDARRVLTALLEDAHASA